MNNIRKYECESYSDFRALIISGASSLLLFSTPFFYISNYTKDNILGLTIVSVLFFFIGIFSFRKFLWLVIGREILIIEENRLILEKKGTFFIGTQFIDRDSVKEIRPTFDTEPYSGLKKQIVKQRNRLRKKNQVFSKLNGGGEITLLLKNYKKMQILNNMSEGEMQVVLESLREWIK